PAWSDPVARALAEPAATQAEIRAGERTLSFTAIAMAEPGSAVLVIEDQTERRRLQEQLIQSEKMSAIGQLIAGVAHDLNNPLASVVGFSDFLAEAGDVPPSLQEPLQVIRQEAERAATIVKNLLSFARSQEGERDGLGPTCARGARRTRLRAVLHHQAGGRGHGAGTLHLPGHHERTRGAHHPRHAPGRRSDLHARAADRRARRSPRGRTGAGRG